MQFRKKQPAACERAGEENQRSLHHVLKGEMLGKQKKGQSWKWNEEHIQVRAQDEGLQVIHRKS